jgi:hypothetical protein
LGNIHGRSLNGFNQKEGTTRGGGCSLVGGMTLSAPAGMSLIRFLEFLVASGGFQIPSVLVVVRSGEYSMKMAANFKNAIDIQLNNNHRYNCTNWTNRFEVAKKNGWTGF